MVAILRVDIDCGGEWENTDPDNGELPGILKTEVDGGLAVCEGRVLAKEHLGDVLLTAFTVATLDVRLVACELELNPRLVEEEPCVRLGNEEFWSEVWRFPADDVNGLPAINVRLAVSTALLVPPNNPTVSIIVEP